MKDVGPEINTSGRPKKRGRGIEIRMKKGYTDGWEGCGQMSYECVTMDRRYCGS